MNSLDDARISEKAAKVAARLRSEATRPWTIMELCSGQAHSLLHYRLLDLLPENISIAHGPGSAVSVTPLSFVDKALAIAKQPDVVFCGTHELLRVRGSKEDLLDLKAEGHDIRIVYSPLDCLAIASANPDAKVVFLSVGFDTGVHPNAMAVWQARRMGLKNFFLMSFHLVASAVVPRLLANENKKIDAFLAPPDVCALFGSREFEALSKEFRIPFVVCGYEAEDLLEGIETIVDKLENGENGVDIHFSANVRRGGDVEAQSLIRDSFVISDTTWRSIGLIPRSRYKLARAFQYFDAEETFSASAEDSPEDGACHSAEVLFGSLKPPECPAFAGLCKPGTPLGAPMSCADGTCALYYLQVSTADGGIEFVGGDLS